MPSDVDVDVVPELVDDDGSEVSDDIVEAVALAELVALAVMSEDAVVGTLFVLDIESVPGDDAVMVIIAVVSAPVSSPLQATRARPRRAAITTGAAPWRSNAEQKGQRLSVSQTWREQAVHRCIPTS